MMLSVICPVLNGEKYIVDNILRYFVIAKPEDKELLIIDGGSTDNTISIVESWNCKYPNIKLINNPDKYVPFALNLGIKKSVGDYISRLDVHTEYPIDYFEKCIKISVSTNADNVGGTLISCGISKKGNAIAHCMSSIFGVGNSIPRIKPFDGFVDSVAFGFWRRDVFEKYGLFNEKLIRNQDEEHNFRIREKGGKILQSSEIKTKYYVREKFYLLLNQIFNYGYYKPKVYEKNIFRLRLRNLIPSFFIIYLCLSFFFLNSLFLLSLLIYLITNVIYSFYNNLKIITKIICLFVYPCIHISYGLGFILGLFNVRRS